MGLFDQIVGAIANPQQQGSSSQLDAVFNTVQQLGNSYGTSPSATQTVLSIVGNHVRSALQQHQSTGNGQAQTIVDQYSGTTANPQAVQQLFTPAQQQQVSQEAAQRTGLNPATVQAMLPVLIPLVLNLLQSGANAQNSQANNPVLNAFLDANHSGNVDIGDVIGLAGRFLNQPR